MGSPIKKPCQKKRPVRVNGTLFTKFIEYGKEQIRVMVAIEPKAIKSEHSEERPIKHTSYLRQKG
jgi:hypothetical protein